MHSACLLPPSLAVLYVFLIVDLKLVHPRLSGLSRAASSPLLPLSGVLKKFLFSFSFKE